MIVVSDTTPIHYLIVVGCIDILPELFGAVVIPEAVRVEMLHERAPLSVREWIQQPPAWIEIHSVRPATDISGLGAGETEAISLAISLKADFLLIDERKGRRVASEHAVAVAGTLSVLELAAEKELVDLPRVLDKLTESGFHISSRMLDEMLSRQEQRELQ